MMHDRFHAPRTVWAAALLLSALALSLFSTGCGRGVKEEDIPVNAANDPLHEPRSILKRYGEGQPMGSETASFPKLVEDVRKVDPSRAGILEKGFADLQKAAASARPALARELHKKLAPSMKGPE